MKLSLEQFLRYLDVEIEKEMEATLPDGKKADFWGVVVKEEKRVSGLKMDFEYEFVLTPQVGILPLPGLLATFVTYKIEGEAERELKGGQGLNIEDCRLTI